MAEQEKGLMRGANWVRVYHAYFQAMVVEGLTSLASRTLGPEMAFNMVAEIIARGAERGFGVLVEELSKEGVSVGEMTLEELIQYEVRCHSYARDKMGVPFQVWEEAGRDGEGRYYLYTRSCVYRDLVERNPATCAVCVGLVTGILRKAGYRAAWVSKPERMKMLCGVEEQRRPELVVYRDPGVKLPECRLVIERLRC